MIVASWWWERSRWIQPGTAAVAMAGAFATPLVPLLAHHRACFGAAWRTGYGYWLPELAATGDLLSLRHVGPISR
ncbi:MAG: hypothetical protein AAF628_36905 [Planctomycetota bacterium]